eukprot:7387861-Prymnesium_polylepis.1
MPRSLKQVLKHLSPAFARPTNRRRSVDPTDGAAPARLRRGNVRPRQRRKSKETLPLWAQGDATFETEENLAARRALRWLPCVVEALDGWWRVTDANGDGSIQRDEYLVLCKKMYKTMIEEWDAADAHACAENDWASDSKGCEEMTGDHFKDAIFELADI